MSAMIKSLIGRLLTDWPTQRIVLFTALVLLTLGYDRLPFLVRVTVIVTLLWLIQNEHRERRETGKLSLEISRKRKVALVSVVGIGSIQSMLFPAPSEARMVANFHQHQAKFEQLRVMLLQDKKISSVGPDWIRCQNRTRDSLASCGISQQRLNQYRILMRNLQIYPIGKLGGRTNLIRFGFIAGGLGGDTWSIGYDWISKIPEDIVPSAYYTRRNGHSRIQGNWYIYQVR
jgi:hypothetical protein